MNIICLIFGHKTSGDRYDGAEYMKAEPEAVDGIGRWHATIRAECSRCEKIFRVGKIHIPEKKEK